MPIPVLVGDDGKVCNLGTLDVPSGTTVGGVTISALGTITSTSATAFNVGRNGATNPVFNVNCGTTSAATGWTAIGAAAASGVALNVISSGTNENGTIDAKGSGLLKLNSVLGTGAVQIGGAASGANATGLTVTPAAAASGLAIAVVSTGTDENLTINAKGAGTLTLNGTATGNLVLGANTTSAKTFIQTSAAASAFASGLAGDTNPVFRLVNNIASQATGISITGRAAAAGVDITVLSSGTDESLVINAKGAGNISLNPTGTGLIIAGRQIRHKVITVPVAAAGTTVADAGQLAAADIVHITSDGATKGVKFPTGVMGDTCFVINDSATAAELYAASGGTINGLSADASVVIPASKGVWAQCTAADTWIAFDLPAKATAS